MTTKLINASNVVITDHSSTEPRLNIKPGANENLYLEGLANGLFNDISVQVPEDQYRIKLDGITNGVGSSGIFVCRTDPTTATDSLFLSKTIGATISRFQSNSMWSILSSYNMTGPCQYNIGTARENLVSKGNVMCLAAQSSFVINKYYDGDWQVTSNVSFAVVPYTMEIHNDTRVVVCTAAGQINRFINTTDDTWVQSVRDQKAKKIIVYGTIYLGFIDNTLKVIDLFGSSDMVVYSHTREIIDIFKSENNDIFILDTLGFTVLNDKFEVINSFVISNPRIAIEGNIVLVKSALTMRVMYKGTFGWLFSSEVFTLPTGSVDSLANLIDGKFVIGNPNIDSVPGDTAYYYDEGEIRTYSIVPGTFKSEQQTEYLRFSDPASGKLQIVSPFGNTDIPITVVKGFGSVFSNTDQSILSGPIVTLTSYYSGALTLRGGITFSNGAYTLPRVGTYLLTAACSFSSNPNGNRFFSFFHSSTSFGLSFGLHQMNAVAGDRTSITISAIFNCTTVNTVVFTGVYQLSGITINMQNDFTGSFCVHEL